MSIIRVKGLSKKINEKSILRDIEFEIAEGEITGLLGSNGSGKTTMIRLLNGVIDCTEGTVEVFGLDPNLDGEEVRKQCGIVTESTNLYHEMTPWENLMFFSTLYGIDDNERAEELLRRFGMWSHKDEVLGSFSTGMKKRVALAKALLHRPKILYLDEPTNGLDPEGIQMVLTYLKELNKEENVTIIICSHVLHQLDQFCDSYIFLNNGNMIEQGRKQEIEERHIKHISLVVQTGLKVEGDSFGGYSCQRISENELRFELKSRRDITPLLSQILYHSWVHSCYVTNDSLDSLYFAVGGVDGE